MKTQFLMKSLYVRSVSYIDASCILETLIPNRLTLTRAVVLIQVKLYMTLKL